MPEEYEVRFDIKAIDFLNKLDKQLKKRIYEKIMDSRSNPKRYFYRLVGRDDYSIRIGEYRAIADIDNNLKTISITYIGHRKNVYD